MTSRQIKKSAVFARNLKQLSKKHPELEDIVNTRIPGLNDQPVFKERLRLRNQGTRGGARIIYYCDADTVLAMFLYLKSNKADIPVKEIQDALRVIDQGAAK